MSELDNEGFTQLAMGTDLQAAAAGPVNHGLFVRFYFESVQDNVKSLEAGRPIFKETEYVRIMVPGDKSSIIERPTRIGMHPAHDNHKFAAEYAAFKQGAKEQDLGTPLKEWPAMSKSQVQEMEYFNVHSVEQLASMQDAHVQKFPGLVQLREQAKTYLEVAAGGAPTAKLQAEVAQRDEQIAGLTQQMSDIVEEFRKLKSGESVSEEVALLTAANAKLESHIVEKNATIKALSTGSSNSREPETAIAAGPSQDATAPETEAPAKDPAPKRAKRKLAS